MLPAPLNDSENDSAQQFTSNTSTSTQYGQHHQHDLQGPQQFHRDRMQEEPRTPTGEDKRDVIPTQMSDHDDGIRLHDSLNESRLPKPLPKDRITEYENNSCPIATLPNEVLVHAIAHLSPNDLAAVALVSRHFNKLVTTPHAWQVAFARYFPGPQSVDDVDFRSTLGESDIDIRAEQRMFARLTALASWRSEYILRTRLLRSLARGKPVQLPSTSTRASQIQVAPPMITYDVRTFTIVNHLHGTFGSGLNKRMPKFIHGADDVGMVTMSDPTTGKVDSWGQSDPHFYGQFSERFPGVAEWGLGSGEVVGCPNVMDVSQPYGMIYGQGCPEGSCYYRSSEERRGRFIAEPTDFAMLEAGIPRLGLDGGAICSVWIAKSKIIPSLSDGLIGMIMGSATGVVTACSVGTDGLRTSRIQRGEVTARWVLSPGVPIIAISIDENYSMKRQVQNRIWAVVLNALGELFYLTKFPTRSQAQEENIPEYNECLAWLTGRSVHWILVEPSRRTARPDPYNDAEVDGSYSPRTSWDGMCLSKDQIAAETKEIRQFLQKPPKHFRIVCLGWDMRRRLEVDFAGDDGNYAGEAIIVLECGFEQDSDASISRFTRWKTVGEPKDAEPSIRTPAPQTSQNSSLFGNAEKTNSDIPATSLRARSSSCMSTTSSPERASLVEEWRCSSLSFGGFKSICLTATTLDMSTFAILTMSEDPALGFSTVSSATSPLSSPMSVASQPGSLSDIPGQRARFLAVGTGTGVVILWNIRAPVSRISEYTNVIGPIRIIYTESPEVSCLALTGLHLVVGGNDGLVQAWDPLASSLSPIRTLNSRHSSRARRRLVQAQASVQGVGINMFAAGAVCLDPDATVLRGAVSLGNQLRYWSYSSSAADQYKSSKRKLRRSERVTNNVSERFAGSGRVNLKDYIANEKQELEREKRDRRKQAERMAGRFGTELLDEDEALAYAAMLSQESMEADDRRRRESLRGVVSTATVTPEHSVVDRFAPPFQRHDEALDADLAEAIRLSLRETPGPGIRDPMSSAPSAFDIPIKYAKGKKSTLSRKKAGPVTRSRSTTGSGDQNEFFDLEFAMQLSLAEEASREEAEDAFPPLNPVPYASGDKGKRRM